MVLLYDLLTKRCLLATRDHLSGSGIPLPSSFPILTLSLFASLLFQPLVLQLLLLPQILLLQLILPRFISQALLFQLLQLVESYFIPRTCVCLTLKRS